MSKRIFITLALIAAAAFAAPAARADDAYPTRTMHIVVPAAAGSTTDILARLVADQLGKAWNQSAVVENISGGAMNVGAEHVARATPDGYTLLVAPPSPITFNHLLFPNLGYDPRKFTAVAALAKIPNVLSVRKDFPANSVGELVAYAKKNPGKITYASQGVGSTAHLSASQLEILAGIKMLHVPYRGAQPALNDVIAGHVDMFFDTIATSTPLFRAGKLKILAVASPERASALPEMPTIAESGLPGFRSVTWFGLVAPPNTPAAIVDKINRAVVASFKRPEVSGKLHALGLEPIGGTPADAVKFFGEETALWGKVIKDAHITLAK
jgi:tripartite-type tricarboxylate transporter receptor subunit TctC